MNEITEFINYLKEVIPELEVEDILIELSDALMVYTYKQPRTFEEVKEYLKSYNGKK